MTKPTTRQIECRDILILAGYPVSAASALVGNFCQEVGPNLPSAFRRRGLDHGSQALPQWRDSKGAPRLTNYCNFVKGFHPRATDEELWKFYGDMAMQMRYVVRELETDFKALNYKLHQGGDAAALAAEVCWGYERPNKALSGIEHRIAWAKALAAEPYVAKPKGGDPFNDDVIPLHGIVDHLQARATVFDHNRTGGFVLATLGSLGAGAATLLRPAEGLPWWGYVALAAVAVVIVSGLVAAFEGGQHATALRQAIANVTPDAQPASEVQHEAVQPPANVEEEARINAEVERRLAALRPVEVQPSADYSPQATAVDRGVATGQASVIGSDATMTIGGRKP